MNSEEIIKLTLNSSRSFSVKEAERLVFSVIEPSEVEYNTMTHKHYFYEMRPLLWLSENLDKVDRVKFMGGIARYDGSVRFKNEKVFQKIEFTRAVDSDVQATKSVLMKMGFSFNISDIFSKKELLKEIDSLWDFAFHKKLNKNAKTLQYQGVWLAIVFDDEGLDFSEDRHLLDIMSKFFVKKHIRQINKVFRRIFIISLSGEYFFDSDFSLR